MSLDDAAVFEVSSSPRPSKAAARAKRRAEKALKTGNGGPVVARNAAQKRYLSYLERGDSLFAIGPAGTGKTYLPARVAGKRLLNGVIEKIVICRVTVSDPKHALGFLPGKIEQKMAPWVVPIFDGLKAELGATTVERFRQEGRIEVVPFEYMRGRTFDNAVLIFDEAQNASLPDLRLALTRVGENCQVVVAGDLEQIDVRDSGLERVIGIARNHAVPMQIVEFTEDDVVRSEFTKAWVKAFSANETVGNVDILPRFLHNTRQVTKS